MKRPLKILYHHRTAAQDGQSVHINELIAALRRAGHDVFVVGPGAGTRAADFGKAGRFEGLRQKLPGFVHELLELLYSFVAYVRLIRAVRTFHPDVIYERYNLFLLSGLWFARIRRLPLLLEVNAPLVEERSCHGNLTLKRLARYLENYAWKHADAVLPVTRVLADMIVSAGADPEKIHVIPNGVNSGDYSVRQWDRGRPVTLGFVGFVRPWHGLDRVLDAMTDIRLADVHLTIAGVGPVLDELKTKAEQLAVADRVHFPGMVERHDIPSLLANFDIALQPDVTPYASPLKLFEYMAAGCAIIAIDRANIREVLTNDESAVLIPAGDQQAMIDALYRLASDIDLCRRLGNAARELIEEKPYSWDGNAARVECIAGKLLV